MFPHPKHFSCKNLQQFLLLQCLFWQQCFVILGENKNQYFPILMGQQLLRNGIRRKWSQACQELQSWAAQSAENPSENRHSEKSAFLLIDFLLFLFLKWTFSDQVIVYVLISLHSAKLWWGSFFRECGMMFRTRHIISS